MGKIGVSWVLRKAGALATSTCTISHEGEAVRIQVASTAANQNMLYPLGKAVPETTMDGRKCQSTVNLESDKIVKTEAWDGKIAKLTYTQNGDTMTQVNIS